jgi:IS5 family transposase
MMGARHAHARQMKRAAACMRKLRTHPGRIIRQIERQKFDEKSPLARRLVVAKKIHAQQKHGKDKLYSVHEPQVACIAKGKADKKYEFGNKVSVAVTSAGGWLLGALSLPGNPYDGHTLKPQLEQVRRLAPGAVKEAYVDMGFHRNRRRTNSLCIHPVLDQTGLRPFVCRWRESWAVWQGLCERSP